VALDLAEVFEVDAFCGHCRGVGLSFTGWFVDPRVLFTGGATGFAYATAFFFSIIFFLDFAWFREQLCNYLCPYARFQGALSDEDSLVVAYHENRGEPRSIRKKGIPVTGACIDCRKCVTVCPQGIDIRNGFQLECITCARCVDACTGVMGKLGEESLISYTTLAAKEGRSVRWFRPRVLVYAGLLTTILLLTGITLNSRHELDAMVSRTPGSLYTVDEDGWIRNTFLVRITSNHPGETSTLTIKVEGLPDTADIRAIPVSLAPEQTLTVPLIIRLPPGNNQRTLPITVVLETSWDALRLSTTFKTNSELEG
jgi:cytochrome c oxidase accessory protein FixG